MSETEDREYTWPHAFFVGQIEAILEDEGISRVELATRMGKTSAYVSQLLGKPNNMTLNTMIQITDALGYRLHPFVYKPSDEAIPRHLDAVQEVWHSGGEELTEENVRAKFLEYMTTGEHAKDSIVDSSLEDDVITFYLDPEFEVYDPTAIIDIFTCAAFLKRLLKINFMVKIDYAPETED